jgi:hypothetical protein
MDGRTDRGDMRESSLSRGQALPPSIIQLFLQKTNKNAWETREKAKPRETLRMLPTNFVCDKVRKTVISIYSLQHLLPLPSSHHVDGVNL